MEFLTELWLPILLAAVLVFILSSVFHMAIPIHKSDHKKLPSEDKILETIRNAGVEPAQYMFPGADSMKEWSTPEMQAKVEKGPIGTIIIVPRSRFNMGRNLALWFVLCLVIGAFAAFVAWHGAGVGADYMTVFRLVAATAIAGYALSHVPDSIWKGLSWGISVKFILEGVLFGLVTAGTFAWLWPDGS